jgi:hypothetical protein
MSDQLVETPTTTPPAEPTGSDPVKTVKTFSQGEIDNIVIERVNREKAMSKRIADEFAARETGYQSQITEYEKIINGYISSQILDLPEPMQKILAKLSIADRIEFLSDPNNKQLDQKRNLPQKPLEEDTGQFPQVKKIRTVF